MNADAMYTRTIESLREQCQEVNSKGDTSLRAFCEKHGINRANLNEILLGKQEISVALFMKISAILAGKPAPELPEGLERWSLRTWLQVDSFSVQAAMYSVNFNS